MSSNELLSGNIQALPKRGISEDTCRKFGYQVGTDRAGTPVQIAPYFEGNTIVAQKLRTANKDFKFIGSPGKAGLFGQQLWRDAGKMVVVTEGEIDCMTVSQLQGNKWPVVSVPNGAQGAKKSLQKNLEWLDQFDAVILMFDMDEPGLKATEECSPLFSPGKCKIARLPLKDPNEMLQAGRGSEVVDAIWGAKAYRPDGIVGIGDLLDRLEKPVALGVPWPFQALTDATFGIRTGEIYTVGAGTGMGKSEVFKETMLSLATEHGKIVGGIFLEETPEHTVRCLAGKMVGKRFHVPDGSWKASELAAAVARLDSLNGLYLYDHFGHTDYDTIKSRIRFMAVSMGVRYVFLDHITALVSGDRDVDERRQLDFIMTDLASLIRELDVALFLVSHLATAEGSPHEEGGRVLLKHFRGSRAIGQWSSFVFGLEGDQQHERPELHHVRLLRCLKDRYTGQANGLVVPLGYDASSGRLSQLDSNPYDKPEPAPFRDETRTEPRHDDSPF